MKFLCVDCDQQMTFEERALPGDGTLAAMFKCPKCSRTVAMLTNPMETQLVSSLGVEIGGRTVPAQPMEQVRRSVEGGKEGAFTEPAAKPGSPRWDAGATERLSRVPSFVRGMVKRIYADYASERSIAIITTDVMDTARRELGLEGM
jgi:hypothetical protein